MAAPFQVLCLASPLPDLTTSAFGPFVLHPGQSLAELSGLCQVQAFDAVLVDLAGVGGLEVLLAWPEWARLTAESAVVVVAAEPGMQDCLRLLQRGARDVLPRREAHPDSLGRVLRLAIERRALDEAARRAYGIDLATGLPNQYQLLEHMNHLLALREREPASMGVIVLQLKGLTAIEGGLGAESAHVVRRKAAVRLRAALRASDVVAALGGDSFAVLLAWIDAGDDAARVARKLLGVVTQPYSVAGQTVPMGARVGVGQYPAHGKEARALLGRALSQVGAEQMARRLHGGAAANDEAPSH